MLRWKKAKQLMKKLFDSGWLSIKYGIIDVPNTCVSYPLSENETKFLVEYFGTEEQSEPVKSPNESFELSPINYYLPLSLYEIMPKDHLIELYAFTRPYDVMFCRESKNGLIKKRLKENGELE